ncbi:Lrp/AsnC family transcriptional regulator [Candidatus Woesearchaeota archaeon]|nr:Lrp/AsnC family transcriptional regulator [Candidatus Woesearchaeota archaeon]
MVNDLVIIAQLRKNARMTLTEMSKNTNVPVSTLYEKIKAYTGNIIKRFTVDLDFPKLGYSIQVMMLVKAGNKKEELSLFLRTNPQVNTLFRTNNHFDYLVEAVFRDLKELEEFNERLLIDFHVKKRELFHLVEELERDAFLTQGIPMAEIQRKPKLVWYKRVKKSYPLS